MCGNSGVDFRVLFQLQLLISIGQVHLAEVLPTYQCGQEIFSVRKRLSLLLNTVVDGYLVVSTKPQGTGLLWNHNLWCSPLTCVHLCDGALMFQFVQILCHSIFECIREHSWLYRNRNSRRFKVNLCLDVLGCAWCCLKKRPMLR